MQVCKRSMCNWQDLHACGNLLIDLAGTSHLLSERWLLESSQEPNENPPIRRPLPGTRSYGSLWPAASMQRAVASAQCCTRDSQHASASSGLDY